MLRNGLQTWHVIVLILVVAILFGSKRLPDVAKSVGESLKIFKKELKELNDDGTEKKPTTESTDPAADEHPTR